MDSLLARRTGRFSRKVEQETTQEMVDPLSKRWVDLLSDGKKEKRRQVGIQKDQKIDSYFVGTDQKNVLSPEPEHSQKPISAAATQPPCL